ncbi:MAG: hypothetical protein LBT89_12525 [Planctomycetaceae bacterium]|jgi:L-2-hydroxyglutarate oxidase LhgO|nr:hypothetical protein [Planctomycetaceae bacterium]
MVYDPFEIRCPVCYEPMKFRRTENYDEYPICDTHSDHKIVGKTCRSYEKAKKAFLEEFIERIRENVVYSMTLEEFQKYKKLEED